MAARNLILCHLNLLLAVCLLSYCSLSFAASIVENEEENKSQVAASSPTPATAQTTSATPRKESCHRNPVATDRLMKELRRVYQSESYKKGFYTVELVNECLYEWRVRLFPPMFDADSQLHKDLVELGKSSNGTRDYLELSFKFKDSYPFAPPFVRIVNPVIGSNGGMFPGGIICMDIFTPQVSFV